MDDHHYYEEENNKDEIFVGAIKTQTDAQELLEGTPPAVNLNMPTHANGNF